MADPGRPGFLVGQPGIVILGPLLFFIVVVVVDFVGGGDVLLRDGVEAVNGGSNRRRRPQQRRLGPREVRLAFLTVHLENRLIDWFNPKRQILITNVAGIIEHTGGISRAKHPRRTLTYRWTHRRRNLAPAEKPTNSYEDSKPRRGREGERERV